MTPPTPDLTALEQWARQGVSRQGPTAHHYRSVLALCETVRAQQQQVEAGISREIAVGCEKDELRRMRDAAVARAEQAERERDALMVQVDQWRRMADREVTACVEMRSDRDDWRQRAEQAQAEVAQLRSERDEMLMLAEHPQISDMRDLARELVYRGQRIIELESAHTEALVPCCVSAACEYCGGTGVAKEMHHE